MLNNVYEQFRKKLSYQYELDFNCQKIYFNKWNEICVEDAFLRDKELFEILSFKKLNIELTPLQLLLGTLRFNEVKVDSFHSFVFDKDGKYNYAKLKPKHHSGIVETETLPKIDLPAMLRKADIFFSAKINLGNAIFEIKDTVKSEKIIIQNFKLEENNFKVNVLDDAGILALLAQGVLDIKNRRVQCTLNTPLGSTHDFPLLKRIDGLSLKFDTLNFNAKWHLNQKEVWISFDCNLKELHLAHWRLAAEPVVFPLLQANLKVEISPNNIRLDSNSMFRVGSILFHTFCNVAKEDTGYKFSLNVQMPEMKADTFFESLPQGMFNALKRIDCSGTLSYRLNFGLNTHQVDSLIFDAELEQKKLRLKHFGTENILKINDEFTYEVFEKGNFVRAFQVGSSNEKFTSLRAISPYLIVAVLQSEDPSFFQHSGFVQSSFRESIIQNIKEKRFARGGSTISMQLVKNVFLNRNKNISRKVEEALLVYLIEHLHLVSKERMLEVYLNIIEWGPNVYGIGEASWFYFNKKPNELTLAESVFLAGIIPNPKYFKYQIESDGLFKPHFENYAQILIARMLQRGKISESEIAHFTPTIKLKGMALKYVDPELYEEDTLDYYDNIPF